MEAVFDPFRLKKAKDKYPDFKYIDILNSQLQSFQLKFTERLENRLSSKTIKVLLSNRKLTGRKRIAFDICPLLWRAP
jgi:hypothetical protein